MTTIGLKQPHALINSRTSCFFGLLIFLSGLVAMTGWVTATPQWQTLFAGSVTMAISSALCFMVAGAVLALGKVIALKRQRQCQLLAGLILVGISAWGMMSVLRFIPWDTIHGLPPGGTQMNPSTIVGIGLSGILLVVLSRLDTLQRGYLLQIGTAIVAGIGTLGLLSYIINMDYLYLVPDAKPMPWSSAAMFVLLSLSIWGAWRAAAWNTADSKDDASRAIYRTIDILVTLIVAVVALVAFGLSQGRSEQVMLDQMRIVGNDKRTFFDTVLSAHLDKALQINTRPAIVKFLRDYAAAPETARSAMRDPLVLSANSFVRHGFSAFSYLDNENNVLASAGEFIVDAEQRLPVSTQYSAELLWKDGYLLRVRLPIQDENGRSGFTLTEQRMDELTRMHREAIAEGDTGDMVVCSLIEGAQHCFPFRWRKKSGTYNAFLDGKALPLTRAVSGETATDITTDFRRQRVMAAFGPIGTTRLGMAVKRDMVELYAPVRRQFFTALPFLGLLVFASVWLIRIRVYPLVAALDQSHRDMKAMALHDGLTGLPNRILFHDRLTQAMRRTRRSQALMALMYLDIDHFKQINDLQGHLAGDDVLKHFADILKDCVRASDTVARLGGDEFTLLLENISTRRDAERTAESILKNVNETLRAGPTGSIGMLTTSIGIAFYRGEELEAEQLIHQADSALYRSKQQGRARYTVHDLNEVHHVHQVAE